MIDEELIQQLEEYIPTERIQEIIKEIDKANNTKQVAPLLDELQEMNTRIYTHHGLNDTTLDFQCYINGLRNKYDIPDEQEKVNDEYVQ